MLFAKSKGFEKVSFGDDWVELQYLSKGIMDEVKRRTLAIFGEIGIDKIKNAKDDTDIPDEAVNSVGPLMDIEYYKLSNAIVKWSAEAEINEQTVKDLDEEVFNKIKENVDRMNKLKAEERKN